MFQVAVVAVASFVACGPSEDDDAARREEPPPPRKDRRALLDRLGRPHRLLIGHGNDLPGPEKNFDFKQAGIYTLPVALDLHYVYLSGLRGERGPDGPGWPEYQPDGAFVTTIATNAAEKNVVPMFTLYQAAARGEQRFDVLREEDFMTKYWAGVRLLFERLRAFGKPALVHLEPDFWGFAQKESSDGKPERIVVRVRAHVAECADLPDDVAGMGRCIVRLGRAIAPHALLGFHASGFGVTSGPTAVARFLLAVGAYDGDFVAVDTLDRDAGCFEAGLDARCQRRGSFYWDESNRSSPSFHEHFAWVKTIRDRLGLPVLFWQTPLGVPSETPGGRPKHYRDNRVRYFFAHTDELEAAGGFGVAFGVGAPNQTDITTDGGQLARAVSSYYDAPRAITSP